MKVTWDYLDGGQTVTKASSTDLDSFSIPDALFEKLQKAWRGVHDVHKEICLVEPPERLFRFDIVVVNEPGTYYKQPWKIATVKAFTMQQAVRKLRRRFGKMSRCKFLNEIPLV